MDVDQTKAYRMKIEAEILSLIEQRLRARQMTASRVREIARLVLETLKEDMSLDEIYRIIPSLDDHFTELVEVTLPIAQEYQSKLKEVVVPHVQKLMAEGKIEEANTILSQAKNREIPVTHYG